METSSFLFKVSHELMVFYVFQAQEAILAQHIQEAVPTDQQSQVNVDNIHPLKVVF